MMSNDIFRKVSVAMHPQLIVSFTSYPARIHAVHQVLESLYEQSLKPDKILLWLAVEQFPCREVGLPKELMDDVKAGKFELRWCDNLGSHKKYFYTMQEHPEDIVVTVDDDTKYHPESIRTLYESYLRHPQAVSALRTNLMLFDMTGNLMPETIWLSRYTEIVDKPSMQLMAVGVGGVLYPPCVLDTRVFDRKTMLRLCTSEGITSGDDVWLKAHEILCGTQVVLASKDLEHKELPETQETALWIVKPFTFKTELINSIRKCYEKNGVDILLSLKKAIEFVTLFGQALYDGTLVNRINYRLSLCNRCKTNGKIVEANTILHHLRQLIRLTPEIQTWAKRSQEVGIRSLYDFGLGLRSRLWGSFRQPPDYLQMQSSWKEFLTEHPNCDKFYLGGYRSFLNDMAGFLDEMEQQKYPVEDVSALRKAVRTGWKGVPLKVRVKCMFFSKLHSLKKMVGDNICPLVRRGHIEQKNR